MSGWLEVSYRKSVSVCDTCRIWVGVDVLISGGGVFLYFWDMVCDWCFVFDAFLIIGGDVRVFFLLGMALHSIFMQILLQDFWI